MKKLLLLFLMLPFVFASCSSDNEEEKGNLSRLKEKIVGTWIVTHYDHRDYGWTSIYNSSYYFTFNSDNTYSSNYNMPEAGSYEFVDAYGGFKLDGGGLSIIKFSENFNNIEWTARDGTDFKLERKK
ncbi:hypothetical protein [uncultured Dysgonomonas sp.]|uniref:Lipocalin-like domain-containing protein n=1 Tax=uncultured Dysgonomonas sp. TaxID=206096 RepID=A0A212IWY7_9BACT|nr:hypothetical protein [uncultured Dysgonomonas sp.]SBV91684.1 exported hypothetical protein [uncultured Dysgonomonas sp.]